MTLSLVLALVAIAAPAQGQPCADEVVSPQRVYAGVFLDEFENQRFFEGAQTAADVDRRAPDSVWMTMNVVEWGKPFGIESRPQFGAYRMRFSGIKRTRGSGIVPCGYGHFNSFVSDMRVVSVLSIEPISID
ncbi:hypothetical protein [Sphingomonas sp.]|uniref:hypothetical protein n=1 Tax=Sphingomonas sp. TaxID=28214 RepID=UPI002B6F7237|nr:hypothetical protein [Sphingomonas sp.]HWK36197.1 hypothetical protein [Sphingomonas sp.]